MSTKLIVYHANCLDGFASAWLTRRFDGPGPVEFFKGVHGSGDLPDVADKDVIIVDFSYKRDVLLDLKSKANSLVVIDHHKSAQADLEGLDFCIFDMKKSGCGLFWDYLVESGRVTHDSKPWMIRFIEDGDIWRFQYNDTKAVQLALRTIPMTFEAWDDFYNRGQEAAVNTGRSIQAYHDQLVDSVVKSSCEIDFFDSGYKVPFVNCPMPQLISDVGAKLCQDKPFSVVWRLSDKGQAVYSMRSTDSGVDVSTISTSRGGGGHRNAAGFSAPASTLIELGLLA